MSEVQPKENKVYFIISNDNGNRKFVRETMDKKEADDYIDEQTKKTGASFILAEALYASKREYSSVQVAPALAGSNFIGAAEPAAPEVAPDSQEGVTDSSQKDTQTQVAAPAAVG